MKNNFLETTNQFKPKLILWIKRIYVLAFNLYAWFWLFRHIFVRHSTNFEDYLLWFFATVGMYYFVLENMDLKIMSIEK